MTKKASTFYRSLAPSYQRAVSWWVMSAKREETRANRMTTLIDACERGERLDRLVPPAKRPSSA